MKKLMVAIAAVASAFGLYADGLNNQIDFKNSYLAVDETLDVAKDDAGNEAEGATRGWYTATSDETGVAVLDEVLDQKVLAVETSSPLYRTVVGNDGTLVPQSIDESGIFFDTTVKFSVGEATETPTLDDGAKLAIWVGGDEEAETPYTNLFVTAGSISDRAITATNFTAQLPANFDFNGWHRITVRTIKQAVNGQQVPGFVIFVDEQAVACADADYADKIGTFTPSSAAAEFLNKNELFLSLVDGDTIGSQTFSGVGFSGSGSLAKVGITDYANAPEFARGEKVFALSWDEGVTGFTANGELLSGLTDSGTTNLVLTSGDTITVTGVAYATGYMRGEWENGTTADGVSGTFTYVAGSVASGNIGADRIAFTIDGTPYASFADALAAAVEAGASTTITLAGNVAGWTKSQEIENGDIILDLAGNTLTFADYTDTELLYVTGGSMIIIDSVGGGKIVANAEAEHTEEFDGVFYCDGGNGIIGLDSDDDKGATFDVCVGYPFDIVKGKFNKVSNEKEDLEDVIDPETYEVVEDGDYWKVQKAGSPEPTTWTVTLKNGETVVDTQTVDDGGYATNVVLDVTGFKGWTNETYTTAFDFATTQITADLTLFAWIEAAEVPDPTETDPEEIPAGETAGEYFPNIAKNDITNANAKAVAEWCQKSGVSGTVLPGGENIDPDAFLLDCANTANAVETAKANFVITSITQENGEWVVKVTGEKGQAAPYGNGYVNIVPADELPSTEGVAEFFKAKLTFTPVQKND